MSDDDTLPLVDEPDERPDPDLDPDATPEPGGDIGPMLEEPPGPINWNLLSAHDAEGAWLELNQWVNWLRTTYGLPASVIPPMWHRHPELHWELSALHTPLAQRLRPAAERLGADRLAPGFRGRQTAAA